MDAHRFIDSYRDHCSQPLMLPATIRRLGPRIGSSNGGQNRFVHLLKLLNLMEMGSETGHNESKQIWSKRKCNAYMAHIMDPNGWVSSAFSEFN